MAWSVVFQRERLEAGVHSDHGDVADPGIYAKHHERPDKARDVITAATGIPVPFLLLLALKVQSPYF